MNRVVLLLAAIGVALALGSGVALAAVKIGTEGHDVLKGTRGEDVIHGRGGWDAISGMGDDDVLHGDEGSDSIHGGSFDLDEIFDGRRMVPRLEEHTSEPQSRQYLVCRLLLEKKNKEV